MTWYAAVSLLKRMVNLAWTELEETRPYSTWPGRRGSMRAVTRREMMDGTLTQEAVVT